MILAVDIGNTHTVLGLFDESGLGEHWRTSSNPALTADELRIKLAALLADGGHALGDIDHVIISSVVPRLTAAYQEVAEEACGRVPMVVGPGLKTGMTIRYDNPHEVGADRIVNGIAAYLALGGPIVVVDFGTATTIDVIDGTGAYLGGAIAPGVETSAEALFTKAARLSKVDLDAPLKVIGTNTRTSVQAGLILGEAAMVDGLVRRVWEELGMQTPVMATGGLAAKMAPICETITAVDPDLTLKGLVEVYRRNT